MLTSKEIKILLADIESDRIERTVSTNDKRKFCEAICAFANDMPGSGEPGYLFVGAKDDGSIAGIDVSDQLLQNLAAHRDSGRIVPLPSLTVQKVIFDEGNLVVVRVLPSDMPPVRYRGQVYVRVGPRKGIASEQEERILTERRGSTARTFDLAPCRGCDKDNIVLSLFMTYRNSAVAPEIIEENDRDTYQQMASLGLWDPSFGCATNAGALLFSEDPRQWFPGAYVQFVRYAGAGLDSDPDDERCFAGDLLTVLRELDAFLKTLFPAALVPASALRQEVRSPYPVPAIRELLMNAIMHRDYAANSPVRFYWFSDRIEIQNPGGLYGSATSANFPGQNDYRNPKIAEAMKILGFVEKFGSGVARAQRSLEKNGNPKARFEIDQPTHFLATVLESGS